MAGSIRRKVIYRSFEIECGGDTENSEEKNCLVASESAPRSGDPEVHSHCRSSLGVLGANEWGALGIWLLEKTLMKLKSSSRTTRAQQISGNSEFELGTNSCDFDTLV